MMGADASKENAFPAGKTLVILGLPEKIVASAQEWTAYSTNGHSVYAERHFMATLKTRYFSLLSGIL